MRLDKVVLRAVLSTLLGIFTLLFLLVLSSFCFFPSTLMEVSYNLGMDSHAEYYAYRSYKGSGELQYLVLAFDIANSEKDYEKIELYASKMVKDDEFSAYCKKIDKKMEGSEYEDSLSAYEEYVYGCLYSAKFRLNKKTEAIEGAFTRVVEHFPTNNSVMKVLLASLLKGDLESAEVILNRLNELKTNLPSTYDERDEEYLQEMINLANHYLNA